MLLYDATEFLRNALRYLSHFTHFFTLLSSAGFMCDCGSHAKLRAKVQKIFEIGKFLKGNMPLHAEIGRFRRKNQDKHTILCECVNV